MTVRFVSTDLRLSAGGYAQCTDGSPLDGLAGYFIEASLNNSDWTRIVTEPVTLTSYIGHCEATPQYRRVVALDLYGNESAPSNAVLIYRGFTPPL